MIENFSNYDTPITSDKWKKTSEKDRIQNILDILGNEIFYKEFEVIQAKDNGQVVLKIKNVINTNERSVLLLNLEDMLKKLIDNGITIWCEPVGDKSKLRQLRGIKIVT